jgi:hypothetical protein
MPSAALTFGSHKLNVPDTARRLEFSGKAAEKFLHRRPGGVQLCSFRPLERI